MRRFRRARRVRVRSEVFIWGGDGAMCIYGVCWALDGVSSGLWVWRNMMTRIDGNRDAECKGHASV